MNNTRYDYSAIVTRPPLRWPNDARVAVWVIPNIEHFHIDRPGTALRPESAQQAPDVYNFAWRDYGLRVGIWRLMAILDKYGVRATVALNAEVCDHYPLIVQEGVKRGWEFMGHGLTNSQRLAGLSEAEEREVIARTLARIEQAVGRRPRGWLGPGLAETWRTPDLLAEAGIEYVGDWCADDQPFPMRVARGELIAMPYTVELNDIPLFLHHHFTGQQFYEAIRDQFDVLYQEGRESGRVMAIALHPFITGVPHRAKYLDQALAYVTGHRHVWLATGSEILDAYRAQLAHAA
ncbi:MAG TPA: polysaccharide deacetylase family protein [Chloroflexota bacterium]|nr:polysaccharide deacetylase family protein [Chloroflexota bacterium]